MPAFIKSAPVRQKGVSLLIDDSFLVWLSGDPIRKGAAFRELERGFRRAMVVGVKSVRQQISQMRAVQYGFMRSTVKAVVSASANQNPMIQGEIGTDAWYDILVHEGLGRHGGSKVLPPQFVPSAAQRAIVEPDAEARWDDRKNWKKATGTSRPFLTTGIKNAKRGMSAEIRKGFLRSMKALKGRGGVPKHNIQESFFGGTI